MKQQQQQQQAHPMISSESNSVQTQQKSFGRDYKQRFPVCIHWQKDRIRTLKMLWSMSQMGGLWKRQNTTVYTKVKLAKLQKCQSLQNVEAGYYSSEDLPLLLFSPKHSLINIKPAISSSSFLNC